MTRSLASVAKRSSRAPAGVAAFGSAKPVAASGSAKSADTSDLRERILRASVELIEAHGLAALSMREVARRAGVSHQAPYHHFPDREAIVAALVEDGFKRLQREMAAAIASAQPPRATRASVRNAVVASAVSYVHFAWNNPSHFQLMFRPELCNLERFPSADEAATSAHDTLGRLVEYAIEKYPAWQGYAAELGSTLWSLAHGFASLTLEGPLTRKAGMVGVDRETHFQGVCEVIGTMISAALERAPAAR